MYICTHTHQELYEQYVTERQRYVQSVRTQKDVVDKIMNLGHSNETKHRKKNRKKGLQEAKNNKTVTLKRIVLTTEMNPDQSASTAQVSNISFC